MKSYLKFAVLALGASGVLGLGACAVDDIMRDEVSMRIASPAWMVKRPVDAGGHNLIAFERMHERAQSATVYVEGDGEAVIVTPDPTKPDDPYGHVNFNATPRNPVGLHLASKDKAENLAYIGRPCQFSTLINDSNCASHWQASTSGRYSPSTIAAYSTFLDGVKARYGVTTFDIVGFGGGATIAALMAAERSDVLTLRTVAGKFDMTALDPSVSKLRDIPQHHFIGGQDVVAPPAELERYLQAIGDSACVDYTFIQEASHEQGWVEKWPELLKTGMPQCYVAPEPAFVPIERPEPIYYPRMGGKGGMK